MLKRIYFNRPNCSFFIDHIWSSEHPYDCERNKFGASRCRHHPQHFSLRCCYRRRVLRTTVARSLYERWWSIRYARELLCAYTCFSFPCTRVSVYVSVDTSVFLCAWFYGTRVSAAYDLCICSDTIFFNTLVSPVRMIGDCGRCTKPSSKCIASPLRTKTTIQWSRTVHKCHGSRWQGLRRRAYHEEEGKAGKWCCALAG